MYSHCSGDSNPIFIRRPEGASTICLYQYAMLDLPTSVAGSMQTDNVVYTGKEGWLLSTRSSMVVPSNDVAADLDWRQVVSPAE